MAITIFDGSEESNVRMRDLIVGNLVREYTSILFRLVRDDPELQKTVPGFLLNPERIDIYVSETHLAIEYFGSEVLECLPEGIACNITLHELYGSENGLFEDITGIKFRSTSGLQCLPIIDINENLILATNEGWDKLDELGWDISSQNSIMGSNTPPPVPLPGMFSRIINGLFFDANETGLKTRHVKWLDIIPIKFDDSAEQYNSLKIPLGQLKKLAVNDAHYVYPMPSDYKFNKLPKINRFIEVWGDKDKSETDITSFLAHKEHSFILTMNFGAVDVHAELTCDWQSERDRPAIRPDFFIVKANGYADILEFKLPDVRGNILVGAGNRESFAAWLNSYISQTRVYSSYFDDPNNRRWFKEKYGFDVYKPRRWLVVGRRFDFSSDVWREVISDYKDVEIINFDDLVDGVVAQFYK
ncbi:hypothetical protein [Pseudomonas sp. PAB10]|uniref:hypothetical protein n=1 Tax=Pseudomonas sp. PAB10 TaxID=3233047 RepID=UPI003F9C2FF6